jgi:hypothetical protein
MISVFIGGSFLLLVLSGVVLFAAPPGRIANWTDWNVAGLRKSEWAELHIAFGTVFLLATLFHAFFNWRPLISYFKGRISRRVAFRWEWVVALLLVAGVFAGTRLQVIPFAHLMAWNEHLKASWDQPAARGPIPHAELLPLSELAIQAGVPVDTAIGRLEARGLGSHTPDTMLDHVAQQAGLSAKQVYDVILDQNSQAGKSPGGGVAAGGRGTGSGGGPGRTTLAQYCAEQDIPVRAALARLEAHGIRAEVKQTLRDIAIEAGYERPSELLPVIRGTPGTR